MILGLLYSSGSYSDKAHAVIELYDWNQDGEIFINSVKKLLKSVFTVCGFLVIALHEGKESQELSSE